MQKDDNAPYSQHYKKMKVEPIEIIELLELDFHTGNALKYLLRHEEKDGIKDLEKAEWYIRRKIEILKRAGKNGEAQAGKD